MQDLCYQLSINNEELMRKIWTCFEHVIIEHTDMMRDRHLDQILMCTIYIICRVSFLVLFISLYRYNNIDLKFYCL